MASPRGKQESSRAEALGTMVRKLRRDRGLTLEQLAERIPMSASNLSRAELGSQGPPSEEVIERIAQALEAPSDDLKRAAGLRSGSDSFEITVLRMLEGLAREIAELRDILLDRKGPEE